jgi:hypothetical protein
LRAISEHRGDPPADTAAPTGPHVQESSGRSGPVVTYEDMLSTPRDEDLFDYYATAQLEYLDTSTGKIAPAGKPGIFETAEPSPDGLNLLVARVHRPYSYLHPVYLFPQTVEVWDRPDRNSTNCRPAAGRPNSGARRADWPARVSVAAGRTGIAGLGGSHGRRQSEGEGAASRPHPDAGRAVSIAAARGLRNRRAFHGPGTAGPGGKALVTDYERNKRWTRTIEIGWNTPNQEGRVIFSRNVQDRYHDPGRPVMAHLPNGQEAILQHGDDIYLTAEGASPSGDHPFLDRYNLATQKSERLFQSGHRQLRNGGRGPGRRRRAFVDQARRPCRVSELLHSGG